MAWPTEAKNCVAQPEHVFNARHARYRLEEWFELRGADRSKEHRETTRTVEGPKLTRRPAPSRSGEIGILEADALSLRLRFERLAELGRDRRPKRRHEDAELEVAFRSQTLGDLPKLRGRRQALVRRKRQELQRPPLRGQPRGQGSRIRREMPTRLALSLRLAALASS